MRFFHNCTYTLRGITPYVEHWSKSEQHYTDALYVSSCCGTAITRRLCGAWTVEQLEGSQP